MLENPALEIFECGIVQQFQDPDWSSEMIVRSRNIRPCKCHSCKILSGHFLTGGDETAREVVSAEYYTFAPIKVRGCQHKRSVP